MQYKKYEKYWLFLLCITFSSGLSCKKFLDEKSNQKQVVISSVRDLQALLDYNNRINQFDPSAGETSADNYYLSTADFLGLSEYDRNIYTWQHQNLFRPGGSNDWSNCYDNVYRANMVLFHRDKINRTPGDQQEWNTAVGHAYYIRGRYFLVVASVWCHAYDPSRADTMLGIPLRLDPDFNIRSVRASLKKSYQQIINDLENAAALLPVAPLHPVRPSKPAAFALLSRAFLYMGDYSQSLKYADSALILKNSLIDFNTLNPSQSFPFARFNAEVIVDANMSSGGTPLTRGRIDSLLYQSYHANDLRKTLFFRSNNDGTRAFRGSYNGDAIRFTGISTAELYLTKAECLAKLNQADAAMNTLNDLLSKRWKTGTFIPLTASSAADALHIILQERRKELLMRDLRWMDIKRCIRDGMNIPLRRVVNNQEFILPPGSGRFALAIPEDVIQLSGMQQNW